MDIFVTELQERLSNGETPIMIDVREESEWAKQTLPGVIKISLGYISDMLEEGKLDEYKDKEVIMICRSGGRSGQATNFLRNNGFVGVRNLSGGMLAWKAYVDPTFNVQ
jgi:rhodanese-related sulfurtransferase